jgi:ribosomal protein S18 acetylase RimI-like enzyme
VAFGCVYPSCSCFSYYDAGVVRVSKQDGGVMSYEIRELKTHVDQIHFGLLHQSIPAKQLADLDKMCFATEAMDFDEWLKVCNTFPIIVCAWQDDDKEHMRGMSVARYAAGIGYLYSSAVVPECRRLGIGERMVLRRLEILKEKGCTLVQAHTRTENEASQKMLSKCGFFAVQYVTDFYDDCEDGVLWQREI